MAAVFSKTTKMMLKNVIRHTNSHNKTVEESEMWQQFERMKGMGGLDPSNPSYGHDDRCEVGSGRNRRGDYWNSRSSRSAFLSTTQGNRRAHMDEEMRGDSPKSSSTYWMRQLEKLETSDLNRWDHSGYRELYPQEFHSDRSYSSSPHPSGRHRKPSTKKRKTLEKKRKEKKKRYKESGKLRSRRERSLEKHKRRAPRRQSHSSDSSDTGSSRRRDRKHKPKKQKKSKKHKTEKKYRQRSRVKHNKSREEEEEEERENKVVIEMWKEENGHSGPSSKDFDRRLEKEITTQYNHLKRKYVKAGGGDDERRRRYHESSLESPEYSHKRKRRRYSPSDSLTSFSDSD